MGRYLILQCKRVARYLPGALLAMAVLMGGLLATFTLVMRQDALSNANQKFQVALVGTADDIMMQMGLTALKTFDSTQLSMEILEMEEAEAHAALEAGTVGAYIVIPENFVDEAMDGHILPLKFVSTTGAASVVSVFKDEVTKVISTLVLESQRGVYGMQGAMKANDIGGRGSKMNDLALTYVEYVLTRDHAYSLQELGISNDLGLEGYLLCGLGVLFLMLACLPFAPLMISRDMALGRMLAARGRSALGQCLCDLTVYCAGVLAAVLVLAGIAGQFVKDLNLLPALPAVLMVAAFSFLLYTLSGDLIGGVLLQFFTALCLCFVSGCMYPVYFFPEGIQKLAAWLPTGAARAQLAACLTGKSPESLPLVLGYTLVFCIIAVALRLRRVKEASV